MAYLVAALRRFRNQHQMLLQQTKKNTEDILLLATQIKSITTQTQQEVHNGKGK